MLTLLLVLLCINVGTFFAFGADKRGGEGPTAYS